MAVPWQPQLSPQRKPPVGHVSSEPARSLEAIWFCGMVVVSVFLCVATALHILGVGPGPIKAVLNRFNLMGENNAGAWWSGMLLALGSLYAFDGNALLRRREPGAARGWGMIAAVLLFFSADEIGSLHERISIWSVSLGLGGWSFLLPLGALLGAVLGRALLLLWAAGGDQRRRTRPLVIGFFLLGSVALQEFIEHRYQWKTDFVRAVRGVTEEGTELLGMLVLLRAAMANVAGLAARGSADERSRFAAPTSSVDH